MSQEPSSSSHNIPPMDSKQLEIPNKDAPPPPTTIEFVCRLCNMRQTCDYFGNHPPFAPTNKFAEECYIKKDPFAPNPGGTSNPSAEYLLVLGANCNRCEQPICRSPQCSIYYRYTICLKCAEGSIKEYPIEIQSKIRKKINESQ